MTKITKGEIISYLVDVVGYSEEEAREEITLYGTSNLTDKQKEEMIEFSK